MATGMSPRTCGLAESCFVSNVLHTYTRDATKIRFGLAGVKETTTSSTSMPASGWRIPGAAR